MYICYHENNVSSRLQPQWLCDNSCTWTHDVHHGPRVHKLSQALHKSCQYSELFWSVFPAFGLNTERYGVSLRIQSECGKIWARITPNTDTFRDVKPITLVTGRTHCFHGCICNASILLLSDLRNLCVVDHLWPLVYMKCQLKYINGIYKSYYFQMTLWMKMNKIIISKQKICYNNIEMKIKFEKKKLKIGYKVLLRLKQRHSIKRCTFTHILTAFWLSVSKQYTAWKVSVFRVFVVCYFPHLDWLRRDTPYLYVFSQNEGKFRPEKLRIRTLFSHWYTT